ncbi:MAG: ABC transporter permease, partial [Gemmatimonadota bacterium]|nr:ABC transporter permease [Gemmatimonadota bacterium]
MSLIRRLRFSRFWPMLWKEFIQMRRDRLTLALITVLPAVQLVLFGYAIQTDVRNLPTVVLDESRTSDSRRLISVIGNTGNFKIVGDVATRDKVQRAVLSARAAAALIIPPEYARDVRAGRTATAQMIVDASDPQTSAIPTPLSRMPRSTFRKKVNG